MFTATCNQTMYNILKEYQGRDVSPEELRSLHVTIHECDEFLPLKYDVDRTAEELSELIPDEDRVAVSELYDTESRLSLARYLSVYSMYQRTQWVAQHNCRVPITLDDVREYFGKDEDVSHLVLVYALNKEPNAFIGAALISEDIRNMTLYLLNGCSTPIIKRVFPMLEGLAERMAGSSDSQIISYLRNHKDDKAWFLDVFRREVVQKYGKHVLS